MGTKDNKTMAHPKVNQLSHIVYSTDPGHCELCNRALPANDFWEWNREPYRRPLRYCTHCKVTFVEKGNTCQNSR